MKKSKRRKKPPGAKKKNVPESNFSKFNKSLDVQKMLKIRQAASDFKVIEEDIKTLDEIAIRELDRSDFNMTIGRLYFISWNLLTNYMNEAWVDKYVLRTKKKNLQRFNQPTDFENYKLIDRVVAFAEMFYNFQSVEGIKEKARQLLEEDVESALGELEGAQRLFAAGRKIKFMVPSGVKGKDYDVETYLSDGTLVACEMKCKFEATNLSERTIEETIKNASGQLPKDILGAVFLKIPESWVKEERFEEVISAATQRAFRHTTTASVVFFHWETWHDLESESDFKPEGARRHLAGIIDTNPKARIKHDEIQALSNPILSSYKRFYEIIGMRGVSFELSQVS